MHQDIHTRLALPQDIDAIHRTHLSSVEHLCGAQYSALQIATWLDGRTAEVYLDAIDQGTLWVAEREGVVGFVEVDGNEVSKMFVAGPFAGQGIGERLLYIALAHIAATGARVAYLESTLTAVEFYKRNGFQAVGSGFFSRGSSPVQLEIIKMERTF
jgi:putative acetyltransferase